MENVEKISWQAFEFEEKEKSGDWFWALGIIIVTACAASLIYGNYFFAALILLGGTLLGFYAVKKPELISYEVNALGLQIGSRIYLYENIKAYWVQHRDDLRGLEPMLFIKTERAFMPVIAIPISDDLQNKLQEVFSSTQIPEEEMREHPYEKILEIFGF